MNGADSLGMDVFGNGGQPGNGLGNLADELADAWDDEEAEEEPDMNFQEMTTEVEVTRDSGVDVGESPANGNKAAHLAPQPNGKSHKRQGSEYDGSDYGEDSDLESPGMPVGLVARMDQIESLVRRGTESNGTDMDSVVQRVVDGLRDLGSQSGVESGATR